jgi:Protein of unknown function (DUF2934)
MKIKLKAADREHRGRTTAEVQPEPKNNHPEEVTTTPDDNSAIATLAYRFWVERGCPEGCPEEDWFRAEQELTTKTKSSGAA